MRERTPSADNTPARAPPTPSTPPTPPNPPTPSTETASAKVVVEPEVVVGVTVVPVSSVNGKSKKMVASSHSLEELGVSHPASASGDNNRTTSQTALDKRSRLSNVINNLRKKVPEAQQQPQIQPQQQQQEQQQKSQKKNENDGRNSVERNLEDLEKYVMTVLKGVIKDEAENTDEDKRDEAEDGKNRASSATEETEASYPGSEGGKIEDEEWQSVVAASEERPKGAEDKNADEALEGAKNVVEDSVAQETLVVVDRKSGVNQDERIQESGKPRQAEETDDGTSSEETRPSKLMDVCRELMNDLLNDIHHLMEGRGRDSETLEPRENVSSTATSLHCSLPLEKVAPILRSCQENQTVSSPSPQKSPTRPSPPMVRHLCLYCDRKFLSISLRQRHAERVHQVGGGSRRSERNSRKTMQSCQYCAEKTGDQEAQEPPVETLDNLDNLFQHMAKSHADRYYACVQCSTRYATRENLANHAVDVHGNTAQETFGKDAKERGLRDDGKEECTEAVKKDAISNPGSPEFDSSFYSSVSCNIRENLLHHLDGKLQTPESKPQPQPQQHFYDSNAAQILFPIDISLTAATPVYTKEYSANDGGTENSSEYAQKPGKTRTHPRRVSFEKYNFPRKYDGREPWSCSIKDLSKFDISTQLTLRKKQQLTKALMNATLNRLGLTATNEQINANSAIRQSGQTDIDGEESSTTVLVNTLRDLEPHDALGNASVPSEDSSPNSPGCSDLNTAQTTSKTTIFTTEFASFMRLKRWEEVCKDGSDHRDVVYAELTGEWSRPRIYICGACADRHVTMKEMEEHKATAHPNVWCSHFEFAGDQRDLYKHLFLPGKGLPTAKAKAAILPEKICTKCSRNCNTLAELHRHMLECGGDQTWLLGLFGNGKKKCKWRPFGSRSRRRRQRGMKRNIQNSQGIPRANTPKERPINGPRVRPSDRESIQKMLANLPPKRASRKVLREENLARSREAAKTVQTRSRPRIPVDVSSSAVQSRNKAALKNKLLKNAKSFQRNRSRIDNITAAIERVVNGRYNHSTKSVKPDPKKTAELSVRVRRIAARTVLTVLSKKKNVKTKDSTISNIEHPRTRGQAFGAVRVSRRSKLSQTTTPVPVSTKTPSTKAAEGKTPNASNGKNQQHSSLAKNLKTIPSTDSKDPEEPREAETKPQASGGGARKKKAVDPVASLKAKQQLRSHDGKFARIAIGKRNNLRSSHEPQIPERYPRRRASTGPQFVPKSRIKATRDFGNRRNPKTVRRNARVASDADRMPTLEPVSPMKNTEVNLEAEKTGKGNELPVLSPVEKRAPRTQETAKKNLAEDHLDLEDVLEKNVIDVEELVKKSTRGKRVSPKVTSTSASITRVEQRSRGQRNSSRKRNQETDIQTRSEPEKKDVVTRLGIKVRGRRSDKVQRTRKSTRKPAVKVVEDEETVKKSPARIEEIENLTVGAGEDRDEDEEEGLPKRGRGLGKRRGRIKDVEEAPECLTNLSLELLQHESSHSNVDSGKENSAETPVTVPKPRAARPRKTKGGRRNAKRTLGGVIGILTEGVNIPVEVQHSVVLTVQTATPLAIEPTTTQNADQQQEERSGERETSDDVLPLPEASKENTGNEGPEEPKESPNPGNSATLEPEKPEPSNDIIEDLSRRKPKGKGSFLEKIVSKIAKKKDVVLLVENDVGSLLDTAADELTSILDEVAPNLTESTENHSGVALPREEIVPEETVTVTSFSDVTLENATAVPSRQFPEVVVTEDSNVSKKRAFETDTPTKNKRKTVDAEVPSELEEPVDEVCLADIMKLIQKPVENGEKEDEVAARPGKRKTEGEGEAKDRLETSKIEDGDSKRPKRRSASKKSLVDEHLVLMDDNDDDEVTKPAPKKINKRKTLRDEDVEKVDEDDRPNSTGTRAAKRRSVTCNETKTKTEESNVPEELPKKSEITRRSSKRKSSLAGDGNSETRGEVLPVSEAEKCGENSASKAKNVKLCDDESPEPSSEVVDLKELRGNRKIDDSLEPQGKKSNKKRKSVILAPKPEEQVKQAEEPEEVNEESKKPKTSRSRGAQESKTRASKRITSLLNEHLDLDSEDPAVSNSETETKLESDEVVERLRPLRRRNSKRKSLAEDHLELFDDDEEETEFKVPEVSDAYHARTRRSSKRSLTLAEPETPENSKEKDEAEEGNLATSLINEHLDLSAHEDEDLTLNESATSSAEITVEEEQQLTPKKRGSGNFAVGHTKTGEILIVEKKKKLTKEAARFFCEVCATSFTRKSSLKKHNSSQSHLIQQAKSEKPSVPLPDEEEEEEATANETRDQDYCASEESIETLNVPKKTLTPQISEEEALEDELLDEEICKITENMTHDDFVLTDHISPEIPAASLIKKTDKNLEKKDALPTKKRNLAEEHLDLDSPSPPEELPNPELEISVESPPRRRSSRSTKSTIVSTSLEETISKPTPSPQENMIEETEFQPFCDEETVCPKVDDVPTIKTNVVSIPVTIQCDILFNANNEEDQSSSSDKPLAEILKMKNGALTRNGNLKGHLTPEEKVQSRETRTPEVEEEANDVPLELAKTCPVLAVEFESDDSSMNATMISVDIGKLLDDPVMSGENCVAKDAEEDEDRPKVNVNSPSKKSRSTKPKRGNRLSRSPVPAGDSSDSDNSDVDATTESQNKNKIVKSVFGRVFGGEKLEKVQDKVKEVLEDWDTRSEDDARVRVTPSSRRASRSKKNRNRSRQDVEEEEAIVIPESKSRRSKKRAEERISKAFEDEAVIGVKEDFLPYLSPDPEDDQWTVFGKEPIKQPEEENAIWAEPSLPKNDVNLIPEIRTPLPSSSSPSSPGQSSVARSSVRNRSPTPDRNSQTSGASESEDDSPRGRLSPFLVRNTLETSVDSVSDAEESEKREIDGVAPSPSSKLNGEETEVVTIAPNDAVEDNAIDVPHTVVAAAPQKPRQAKVLNFDEELFVECCSRLKATTENELRGAKKIEIDHSDGYHKKEASEGPGFWTIRDRWRDVESQNSLGSLLESVNQFVGEEMYANNEKAYSIHTARDPRSENSSRSGSPDPDASSPPDNLGYEDSLDVAFEYNNKLRDKIQQRMRESENLIASSFASDAPAPPRHQSYGYANSHGVNAVRSVPADESRTTLNFEEHHATAKNAAMDSAGFKHKMNSTLGGLLDKLALSNLLHSSAKHDHNGSTPMKVLAELACARAPTTTTEDLNPEVISKLQNKQKDSPPRKIRNPIKELFERKKELNERNQSEKTRTVAVAVAALKELNVERQRKTTKKSKKRVQEHPLVRKSPYGGMAERKKRRDLSFEKKDEAVIRSNKIKDVYDFDDEESQADVVIPSVVSFRSKVLPGEIDVASLTTKAIVETLENGKEADVLGRRLESMIDRKFKEIEKSAPKTKGALKAFHTERGNSKDHPNTDCNVNKAKEASEEQVDSKVGPMDEFVQRKQHSKRNNDLSKRSKSKKRSKTSRKKSRAAAWYENDSSDEFRTAAKTEDVGVGISKSQRTCSKGKQNLFAELSSTSSESEIDNDSNSYYGTKRAASARERVNKSSDRATPDTSANLALSEHNKANTEPEVQKKIRNYSETKKSESEMSDHPLIIDERRESDEDSSARNNYEPSFEMDDLYREDSTDDAETECPGDEEEEKLPQENCEVLPKAKFLKDDELIPLEEALDLLDPPEALDEAACLLKEKSAEFFTDREVEDEVIVSRNEEYRESSASPVEDTREEEELAELPEKLCSNEKPTKTSDNLPLHVFLSRKVQESKKRKQQHLKKLQEEQERILLELQPTRRQRKCAIGKQGLLAEISSSDEDSFDGRNSRKIQDKERSDSPDKPQRKQKRELREKRKERYIEKKHEQIIAKEQKAIEEEILRELGKRKDGENSATEDLHKSTDSSFDHGQNKDNEKSSPRKQKKQKSKKTNDNNAESSSKGCDSESETNMEKTNLKNCGSPSKQKKKSKTEQKSSKKSLNSSPSRARKHSVVNKPVSECNGRETKESKERRSSGIKRDSADEELRTTKSWNKVEEGVGVAIGRRKRAAANQLYYWSSSSDEEEEVVEEPVVNAEEEDDRQEQHGWIVGDSHKRMITMLAMEKQLKEKRRRSEDEFEPNKAKNKKHRNSTS